MGPLVHPTNHYRLFGLSVRLSVSPDRFSRAFPEEPMVEWPETLHANVFLPPSELIRLWSRSVDFPLFGVILT